MSEPTEPAADSYRNIAKSSDTWCGFWNRHLLREYVAVAVLVAIYLILTNTVSGPILLIPNAAPNITVAELSKVDTYIGFPLLDDTVPVWVVGVLMLAPVPLLSLTVSLPKGSLFELHSACLMTIEASVMNLLFTDVGKILAARYRPDYLARCSSFDAAGRCVAANASTELDGRRSFPSGHSSGSFCGMILLALYLAGKLRLYYGRRAFWKLMVCAAPPFVAFYIAISRTVDYHHNYSDVLAGACIGTFAAYVCYFMHYHALDSPQCAEPLPIEHDEVAEAPRVDLGGIITQ